MAMGVRVPALPCRMAVCSVASPAAFKFVFGSRQMLPENGQARNSSNGMGEVAHQNVFGFAAAKAMHSIRGTVGAASFVTWAAHLSA